MPILLTNADVDNYLHLHDDALYYINYLEDKLTKKRKDYDDIKKLLTNQTVFKGKNGADDEYPLESIKKISANKLLVKKYRRDLITNLGKLILFIFSEIKSNYYVIKRNMKEEFVDMLFTREMFNEMIHKFKSSELNKLLGLIDHKIADIYKLQEADNQYDLEEYHLNFYGQKEFNKKQNYSLRYKAFDNYKEYVTAKCQDAHPKCKSLKKRTRMLRSIGKGRFSKMSKKDRKEEVRMFCQLNEPEGDDYSLTYPTDSLNVGGSDLCPKTCKKYRKKYPKCEPEFIECIDKEEGSDCKTPGLFGKPGRCSLIDNGNKRQMVCKTYRRSKRVVLKKSKKRLSKKKSRNSNSTSTNNSNSNSNKVSIENINNNKPKVQTQKRKRRRRKIFIQKLFGW